MVDETIRIYNRDGVDLRSQYSSYSRPRNNGDSEDQFVVEDTDDVSIYSLYSVCTST